MTPEREDIVKRTAFIVVILGLYATGSWWQTGWSWYTWVLTMGFAVVAMEMAYGSPSRPRWRFSVEASVRVVGFIVALTASPIWLRFAGVLTFVIPGAIDVLSWQRAERAIGSDMS